MAAAEWAAALPCKKAVASVSPAAGPKKPGGVAALAPIGRELLEVCEVRAGYVLAVRLIDPKGRPLTAVSVYLP
eukprot:15229061-Alexandrium_andersonii.AAC.1